MYCLVHASTVYACNIKYYKVHFIISIGLPPTISVVNGTGDKVDVTTETTEVSLYFEVVANPPHISNPQLTVNNTNLPSKWQVTYRAPNMDHIVHFTSWSHFFVELTEDFTLEDNGDYTLTVMNTCGSSNKTVTVKGKYSYSYMFL